MAADQEPAPAKINLALHVRGKRPDGYHALESLFVFAEHGDVIEGRAMPDGEISFSIEGPFATGLDAGDDNLVIRAANALKQAARVRAGAALRLQKYLPIASGIGGGSADAAATLRLLNRLWALDWPLENLLPIAEELGSDVPACLVGGRLKVTGRGEGLEPAETDVQGLHMLLVNPGVALSTAQVFAAWDKQDRGPLGAVDLAGLKVARNDLEAPASTLAPAIGETLSLLRPLRGVRLVRMSGSGATCFALFKEEAAAIAAEDWMRAQRPDWWTLRSRIA